MKHIPSLSFKTTMECLPIFNHLVEKKKAKAESKVQDENYKL